MLITSNEHLARAALGRVLGALQVAFCICSPVMAAGAIESPTTANSIASSMAVEGTCIRNHDGDTITVKIDGGKQENIRLLGIDTAEMAQGPWGAKARDFTANLVKGKRVRIETDVQQRDRYGRMLGYVYVGDTFVNLELMKSGMAMLLTYPPNVAHTGEFTAAQTEARNAGRGLWDGVSGLKESPHDFRHKGEDKGKPITRGQGMRIATQPKTAGQVSGVKAGAAAGQVFLNSRSLKYHEPGCRYHDCANCEPVTLTDAKARGGVPCKVCH